MRYAIIFLVLFALLVLQGGFVAYLGFGFAGNLILLFTVITVILGTFEESFFTVLVGGLMLDLLSGSRAGINMISLFAVFGFTHIFITKFVPRQLNRIMLVVCVGINTFLYALVFVIANRFLNLAHLDIAVDFGYVLGKKFIFDLIVNIVLAYPMLYIYQKVRHEPV